MPKIKEIRISKFYLLAWLFGLAAVFFFWKGWFITGAIFLIFFWSYSKADYQKPPHDNTNDDDSSGLAV